MFDMGFWEILVILVIALLVIGPDKLPGVARQVGKWVGRTRAYITSVKADIDREMRLQELQDMMKNNDLHDIVEETKSHIGGLNELNNDKKDAEPQEPKHTSSDSPNQTQTPSNPSH